MKTIGVIPNKDKDVGYKYTRILVESICGEGGKVKLASSAAKELGLAEQVLDEEAVLDNSDIVICLGGDGTFLKAARSAYTRDIPILGVNLGNLGFLTEIDKNDIHSAVENIMQGKYTIEERMMLEATVISGGSVIGRDIALNDVVISSGALSRVLHLKTYMNDVFVDMFPGDGLIVSSPTGSTGYSLSAGGPIVEPDNEDLIVVTPICPHILYSRSFITSGSRVVRVTVDESGSYDAMVTVDGQVGYQIKGGDSVEVKKALQTVKMIRILPKNFYNILRSKIYDRGERVRKNEI